MRSYCGNCENFKLRWVVVLINLDFNEAGKFW